MRGLFGLLLFFLVLSAFSQYITWNRTIDIGQQDYGNGVLQTEDGGYMITGYTGGYYDPDLLICRLDPYGDTLWTKICNDEGHSTGYSIVQAENGYIISGFTSPTENYWNYRVYVLKVDADGDTVWTKKFGTENRYSPAIIKTQDDNYVLLGCSYAFTSLSYDLIKLDEDGTILWSDTYSWPWGLTLVNSLEECPDGDFILSGEALCSTFHSSMMITKVGSTGDSLWTKYYYGDTSNARAVYALPLDNEELLICGTEDIPNYQVNKLRFIKVDGIGNIIWEKEYYQWGDYYYISKVRKTDEDFYLVSGRLQHHMFLMKTDINCDSIWTKIFQQDVTSRANDARETDDGGIIVCGGSAAYTGASSNIWVLKLDKDGLVAMPEFTVPTQNRILYNFPNPFTNGTTIAFSLDQPEEKILFSVFDLKGKVVYQKNLLNSIRGINFFDPHTGDLPNGMLFYSVEGNSIKKCKSMLKLK